MKSIEIKGSLREKVGKKSSKDLRKQNMVPCVLYGLKENVHFSSHENEFIKMVFTPNSYIIDLNIDGKIQKAMPKDIQYHPVSDKIIHVDFRSIAEGEKIVMPIPVKVHGFAKGVKDGGKLNVEMRKVHAKALPEVLPDVIEIDVENLELGKTIKISDLKHENFDLVDDQNSVIVSVRLTRVAKSDAADGTTPAEGAAEAATEEKK